MTIEHNKDLHIELLRDELFVTRKELEKRFKTHEAFRDIVSEVHSTVKLEELKEKSKAIIEDSLSLDEYALIVWENGHRRFVVTQTKGMTQAAKQEALHAVEHMVTTGGDGSGRESDNELRYLPMNEGKMVFGALCLPDEVYARSDQDEQEFLRLSVRQLSQAIENAVVYETARRLCVTDDKTLLYNHRYLTKRLDGEIKRAARFGRQVGCLMLDLDDFKAFNDKYGHVAGDEALSAVAGVIRKSCREIDIPARFGGEEFTIVLPETGVTGAETAAKRIIEAVRQTTIETGKGSSNLTISAGVAVYPLHARDASDLVKQADLALFEAKSQGKDRFMTVPSAFETAPGDVN
jgi:diguanylate cyclase (GGDEF)-like protein